MDIVKDNVTLLFRCLEQYCEEKKFFSRCCVFSDPPEKSMWYTRLQLHIVFYFSFWLRQQTWILPIMSNVPKSPHKIGFTIECILNSIKMGRFKPSHMFYVKGCSHFSVKSAMISMKSKWYRNTKAIIVIFNNP